MIVVISSRPLAHKLGFGGADNGLRIDSGLIKGMFPNTVDDACHSYCGTDLSSFVGSDFG